MLLNMNTIVFVTLTAFGAECLAEQRKLNPKEIDPRWPSKAGESFGSELHALANVFGPYMFAGAPDACFTGNNCVLPDDPNKPSLAVGDTVTFVASGSRSALAYGGERMVTDVTAGNGEIKYAVDGCAWYSRDQLVLVRTATEADVETVLNRINEIEESENNADDEDDNDEFIEDDDDELPGGTVTKIIPESQFKF